MDPKDLTKHLAAFKSARDAALHADGNDLTHHLREFVSEVKRNPLCREVLSALPAFDVDGWWTQQVETLQQRRHAAAALALPDHPDEKLAALWELTASMGSGDQKQLDFRGFGRTMNAYKSDDAASKSISMVIRPFAEAMSDRLRDRAGMVNPRLRELAGVPLAAVPAEDETKIFLSHRSADKDLVRPFADVLRELGYQPWIDDHAMPAGTILHRGISAGMDSSCAVVFFVTPNFEDERWLAREVDHAISRKVDQGDRFAVITLLFKGGQVPRALREYVYHEVRGEADAIKQIVRALPIELGPSRWRAKVYRK